MGKFYLFNDPDFSLYVFHCMHTASQSQRNELDPIEIKHFTNERTMRRFADNESLEKRLLMLSRLGIHFTVTLTADIPGYGELLPKIADQYKKGADREDLIKAMIAGKTFVISSKEVMLSSQMAAQNSHTNVFVLNYEYRKVNQYLIDFKNDTVNMDFDKGVDGYDKLAKIMLSMWANEDTLEAICGVTEFELRILLALFPLRNTYITLKTITQRINVSERSMGVARVCSKLVGKKMIAKSRVTEGRNTDQVYTIMDTGLNTVGKYIRYVFQKASI